MPHDFTLMYALHDAIRRDLVRIVAALGGSRPVGAARAAALAERWRYLAAIITSHQEDEDARLWPAARAALGEDGRSMLDRLESQHGPVSDAVEATSARFDELTAAGRVGGPAREEQARVADAAERVLKLLDAHFAGEEDHVLPALAGRLDDTGWAGYDSVVRMAAGSGGNAAVLPWLLDDAPPARVAAVLGPLPHHVRTAYAAEWKPAYRELVAAAW